MTDATNKPLAETGEPVAWLYVSAGTTFLSRPGEPRPPAAKPLYTHPQPLAVGLDRDALRDEVLRLRAVLLGIAETDRYRRYPKQHEDGGLRGQSGLRAVRALTGKHGSYINDDEVRQLNADAILALAAPAEGWQGIETAPKDGTRFIGRLKSGRAVTVVCQKHHNGWVEKPGGGHVPNGILDDVFCEEEASAFVPRTITHWMPLPAAPTGGRS